jgi:outer membrane receptor protein involved in Fe transport
MKRLIRSGGGLVAVALVLLVPAAAWAQSSVTTGQVYGTAKDPNGAVMPGVTIQAKNVDTGLSRSAVTDTSGYYRIDQLPSGTYDVTSMLDGFKTEVKRGVAVTLGSSVQVNFALAITSVQEEIVVTAESPIVESTNPSITSAVTEQEIANLPLQGRDFTDFVVLTPGAVAGNTDEVIGGRGGINIGARAVQNSFNIDGANSQSSFFGEERGGTRPPFTFSQAAIKEFQVLRSSYNLQFQATGGVINAITKSGTNEFHGQVFGYYTDDSLTEEDALGRKEESEQKQYGFALGGPIIRDKLHFFTSLDAQDFQTPHFTAFYDFPEGREADFQAITGLDYNTESGNYPTTNDALVVLLKFDWQLGVNNLLSARYNYSDQEGVNQTSGFTTTGLSNNGLEGNSFSSLVFTLNSVLSDRAFNEAFGQYAFEERPRAANNTTLPETMIRWYDAVFGQNQFLPNFLDEKRYQLVDNFTYYAGDHTLKAGINFDWVNFDDGFCRYCSGYYEYWDWDDFLDQGSPAAYTQAFSDFDGEVEYDTNYYAFYLQDDWRASPNLTVNFGLRYDLQDNPTPYETNPLWPNTGQIPTDNNNWSIRAGFAWDIRGDGKQVLRGGLGRFYDNTPTLLLANAMLANGVRVVRVSGNCGSDIDCPTYPEIWTDIGDLPSARSDIFVFDPSFENPETNRISLGYEAEVVRDLSLGVDVIYYETEKLQRKQDQNLEPNGGETLDGRPTYDRYTNVPELGKIMQFNSDARAEYTAIMLTARKRFSNKWFLDASYTWSDAKDNDSNERSVSSSSDYADDQYNLDADWGPSNFDSTHKLVASFAWQLPANFLVSAIGTYRTGFPYSALDDRDLNTDGYVNNERAVIETSPGVYYHIPRNEYRQPDFKTLDLRLTWTARFGRNLELELIGEVFNALNNDNWITTEHDLVNSDGSLDEDFGELDIPGLPRRKQVQTGTGNAVRMFCP